MTSVRRLCFREPLMQTRADIVGRVRISPALIARYQRTARHHAGDTGQPNPLPYPLHGPSLPKLRW